MTGSRGTKRIVALWLPDWPLTVRRRTSASPPDGLPFALVERGKHGVELTALNDAARAAGLKRGQRHADARAMVPALLTASATPDDDAAALERLAHWCLRWSPVVAVDGRDGLFVDVSGSAHLFGGDTGLAKDLRRRFDAADIGVRIAIAETAGAAWAAARFGGSAETTVAPGTVRATLGPYPIAALRVEAEALDLAAGLGLKLVRDLYDMPRRGLARRFGTHGLGLVRRLDQLLGVEPEALSTIEPPRRHSARVVFAEPVIDAPGVAAALPRLLEDLAAQLDVDGLGALELSLTGYRIDGGTTRFCVRLGGASRRVALWRRLIDEKGVEHLDLGFGIDALRLTAERTEAVAEAQPDFADDTPAREPLGELCDRLAAKLGDSAVLSSVALGSWLPERAEAWRPVEGSAVAPPLAPLGRDRPLLLLDPPEPIEASLFVVPEGAPERFRWRRVMRRVTRAEGPERLSPEWWRNPGRPKRTRDYYRVEDDGGTRYWLFREGLYGWEDDDKPPSWWLHGLFA